MSWLVVGGGWKTAKVHAHEKGIISSTGSFGCYERGKDHEKCIKSGDGALCKGHFGLYERGV
jgi:hypothetical protein